MRNTDGRRDLSLIRASGSTARVLNLALVFERFGHTEDYQSKPLFKHKRLNRALIIKHAVRAHERDLFKRPTSSATKVILPYASTELELGGVSFMVNELKFERLMRDILGDYESDAHFESDLDLLRSIAALPSFDPFLMRERLRHLGVDASRSYFEIAEADVSRMRAFVGREISQLVSLAFATGGRVGGDLSNRLAEKLMTDETAKTLDPLREVLRLSGDEYVEGVFAWKGFLYYKWLMAEIRPQLADFNPRFAGLRVMNASSDERRQLADTRKAILRKMAQALHSVDQTLLQYGSAFAALAEGQPGAFRMFLLGAPALFIPIGEAVGVIRHIHSFWNYRFPGEGAPLMELDEALEILHDFETTIGGVQFVQRQEQEIRIAG